ncbi:MAG TPA: hypothetical protein VHA82_05060 [Ramlibacter sp.]|uniref:hypothetical protein n=1 Tax=Ramlibacter sp. TaxID=1917967 RepID=UPI002B9F95B8|nr:hypothetical protein [Ramlibacter sp.]HVZ43160.1 hypothetical protein [Ramlibacter sp.]
MEPVVAKHSLRDPSQAQKNLAYWLAQPIEARIAAVEALRLQRHPELSDADQGLQRVCRITRRQRG